MSVGRARKRATGGRAGEADRASAGAEEAARLRRHVEQLSTLSRGSATAGELHAARWVADRLRGAGASEVSVERFRYQSTYGVAHALHFGSGVAAAALGGRSGAGLALAALASFELEFSGRRQWLRRLLPAGEGANVVARLPAARTTRGTLVLVAHHDAARTGLIWHPRLMAATARRADRTGRVPSFAALPEAALAAVALGCAAAPRRGRAGWSRGSNARRIGAGALRKAGAAVLTLAAGLALEVAQGRVVPGAFDNATGVAALLALTHRFAEAPLEHTEVVALATGCEEAGMGGMRAWLDGNGAELDPSRTLVLGLDGLGAGEPVVLAGEGPVRRESYRKQDLQLAYAGALLVGLPAPRPWRIGGWSDPVIARIAGFPAVCLMSVRDGGFPNYHRPTDTPDEIDWTALGRDTELAAGIAAAFDSRQIA